MSTLVCNTRPKTSLESLYKATHVAEKIHRFTYACEARIIKKAAHALKEAPDTAFERLKLSTRLAIYGGTVGGLSLSGNPNIDVGLGAWSIDTVVPTSWRRISVGSLGTYHITVLALLTAVAVGTGTPNDLSSHSTSGAYRLLGDIFQYGVLGLPQAALIKKWNVDQEAGKHASANACILAATLIAIPLESFRAALALAVVATSVPLAVIFCGVALALNTGYWAYDHTIHPGVYASFMDKPRALNAGRDHYHNFQSPPNATFVERQVRLVEIQQTLDSFSNVLNGTTQQEVRAALLNIKSDRLLMTEILDDLRQYFNRLSKSLNLGDRAAVAQTQKLFAQSATDGPTPSWVVSRYRHIVRFLHPDKLSAPGQALPPDTEAMALACFGMLTSLRDLHAAQPAQSQRQAA